MYYALERGRGYIYIYIYIHCIYIHAQIDTGYINPEDLAYLGRWSCMRWRVSEEL